MFYGKVRAIAANAWVAIALCLTSLVLMGCATSPVESPAGGPSSPSASGQTLPQPSASGAEPSVSEPSVSEPSVSQTPVSEPSVSQSPVSQTPVSQPSVFERAQILPVGATVQFGDKTIELEVTRTPEEQAMGLMFREQLPDDRGMLFRFDPPRIAQFWMKNVVIDLDMVFLHQGKIVAIAAQVPPCDRNPCPTYGPINQRVDAVIELRGGLAAELGLKAGDAVAIAPKQP